MTNLWRRLPTRLKRVVLIISFASIGVFGVSLTTVIGFSTIHPTVPHKIDAVIVLGAKVGTPALKYRTLTALKYYEAGKTDTIVLSGSQGPDEPVSEAQAMADIIREHIIKTHGTMPKVTLETQSANTFENLDNSRALIPNAERVVVVSDGYHLARSVFIARHAGFQTVYWDAPQPFYYATLDLAHYYVREAIALIVYIPKLL